MVAGSIEQRSKSADLSHVRRGFSVFSLLRFPLAGLAVVTHPCSIAESRTWSNTPIS